MTRKHVICGSDILKLLEENDIRYECDAGFPSLVFAHIDEYADRVRENGLYIYRRFRTTQPSLKTAVRNGALGFISDERIETGLPYLYTPSVFKAAAVVCRAFYNDCANHIEQICVIGTKGKTTTSRMVHAILSAAEKTPVAFCTTNRMFDGKSEEHFSGTVSDPTIYYPLCERAIDNGCLHMVSEMPSYAELCARLTGLGFSYGIFTNLDYDHVSPFGHKTYENYVDCKKKMFSRCRNVLVNLDDPRSDEFLEAAEHAHRKMTFSPRGDSRADFRIGSIRQQNHGHAFTVETPTWKEEMYITIPGIFNVSNALAAISQAWIMDIDPILIRQGIRYAHAQGRMEILEHNGYLAFVDYAHNGISFRAVLDSLKTDYPDRKIVVVTGIGGRVSEYCHSGIAQAISRYSHRCIITMDNPLDEDPAVLCQDMKDRIVKNGGNASIIPDRKEAIRYAVESLRKDEVLLVAGKGEDREIDYLNYSETYEGDDILTEMYLRKK